MGQIIFNDDVYMKAALAEAKLALDKGEIPVGAVVVCNNRIIARSHNLTETLNDTTAHAEMQAITAASDYLGGKYLDKCSMYVTLEPCVMCAGALFWSRIGKIVYGASDEKRGYSTINASLFHTKTQIIAGVMKAECADILHRFFWSKRND